MLKECFSELVGYEIKEVTISDDKSYLTIRTTLHHKLFVIMHEQECCEFVQLVDYEEALTLRGRVVSVTYAMHDGDDENSAWVFVTIQTDKDSAVIRFLGNTDSQYSVGCNLFSYVEW